MDFSKNYKSLEPQEIQAILLDKVTNTPLPFYQIQVQNLDQEIGTIIKTNEKGEFKIRVGDQQSESKSQDKGKSFYSLRIFDEEDFEVFQTDVPVESGSREPVKILVPTEKNEHAPTLKELEKKLNISLPYEIQQDLGQEELRALHNIQALHKLKNGLEESIFRRVKGHIQLNMLSSTLEENDLMVNKGISDIRSLATKPFERLLELAEDRIEEKRLRILHREARLQLQLVNNMALGEQVARANGFRGIGGRSERLRNPTDVITGTPIEEVLPLDPWLVLPGSPDDDQGGVFPDSVFTPKCECEECRSSVSPAAYLADLLRYATDNLEDGDKAVDLEWLEASLFQPFSQLLESCENGKEVLQSRISVEVLRKYLGLIEEESMGGLVTEEHTNALELYITSSYLEILKEFGTSYYELREALLEGSGRLESLSDRLGISSAHLPELLLDTNLVRWAPNDEEEVPLELTENKLWKLFGLCPTIGRQEDKLEPNILNWRFTFLSDLWANEDHQDTDGLPIIDPHQIGSEFIIDIDSVAFSIWESRHEELGRWWHEELLVAEDLFSFMENPIWLNISWEELSSVYASYEEGQDIGGRLEVLGISLAEFLILYRVLLLVENDQPVLQAEVLEFKQILLLARKRRSYINWTQEEIDEGITLSPDFFQIPDQELSQIVNSAPAAFFNSLRRNEWERKLEGRIEQKGNIISGLIDSISTVEEKEIPLLRNKLIENTQLPGIDNTPSEKIKFYEDRLLMDFSNDGCQKTTRLSQAIITIQLLIWRVTNSRLGYAPFKNLQFHHESNFEEEWSWLGTYATWRSAMFVFMYPESVLDPNLHTWQSWGFRELSNKLKSNRNLSPDRACILAKEYQSFFRDICNLQIQATCETVTGGISEGGCDSPRYRKRVVHLFGTAPSSNRAYWAVFDPNKKEILSSESIVPWQPIKAFYNYKVESVIGAIPYKIVTGERYLFVIATTNDHDGKRIIMAKLSLDSLIWINEEPLEILKEKENFSAVALQTRGNPISQGPGVAIQPGADSILAPGAADSQQLPPVANEKTQPIVAVLKSDKRLYFLQVNMEGNELSSLFDGGIYLNKGYSKLVSFIQITDRFFCLFAKFKNSHWYRYFDGSYFGFWKALPSAPGGISYDKLLGAFFFEKRIRGLVVGGFMGPILNYFEIIPKNDTTVEIIDTLQGLDDWIFSLTGFSLSQESKYFEDIPRFLYATDNHASARGNILSHLQTFELEQEYPIPQNRIEYFNAHSGVAGENVLIFIRDIYLFPEREMVHEEIDIHYINEIRRQRALNWIYKELNSDDFWDPKYGSFRLLNKHFIQVSGNTNISSLYIAIKEILNGNSVRLNNQPAKDEIRFKVFDYENIDRIAYSSASGNEPKSKFIAWQKKMENSGGYISKWYIQNKKLWVLEEQITPEFNNLSLIKHSHSLNTLQERKNLMENVYNKNINSINSNILFFQEAYFFVSLKIAQYLHSRGYFQDALDWYRFVFDYYQEYSSSSQYDKRKIYHGLEAESSFSINFQRSKDWLSNPFNPHAIAGTRKNSYTRSTIISIVKCLLDFADQEFTIDTAENISKAKVLYEEAKRLLDEIKDYSIYDCEQQANNLVFQIKSTLGDINSLPFIYASLKKIVDPRISYLKRTKIREELQNQNSIQDKERVIKKIVKERLVSEVTNETVKITEKAQNYENLFLGIVSKESILNKAFKRLKSIPTIEGKGFFDSDSLVFAVDPGNIEGERVSQQGTNSLVTGRGFLLLPRLYDFCIPLNPELVALQLRSEINLEKINNCLNIAGLQRKLAPFSAPTDSETGLPFLQDGQLSLTNRSTYHLPVPYRFSVLIERAKQLVELSRNFENSLLSAIEKFEEESYKVFTARQDLESAYASMKLQDLRISEANINIAITKIQKLQSQIQVDTYDNWINQGLLQTEHRILQAINELASHEKEAINIASKSGIVNAITSGAGLFNVNKGKHPAADVGLSQSLGIMSLMSNLAFSRASNDELKKAIDRKASVDTLRLYASLERQQQRWELQKILAERNEEINSHQIEIAQKRVEILEKEAEIYRLQYEKGRDTINFFNNEFGNSELYQFIIQTLEGVYTYFLSLATSIARLAESQLLFERQVYPTNIIRSNYWDSIDNNQFAIFSTEDSNLQKGITGSSRLLNDIYKLDQYAFDKDKRKLKLIKTFNLERLFPLEFHNFVQTGEFVFSTPMDLFDFDYPGHYLRLISQVNVAMGVNSPERIRGQLYTTGVSWVVIKDSNGLFKTVPIPQRTDNMAISPEVSNEFASIQYQPEADQMLRPFEGMGVHTTWVLSLPKESNPTLNYSTISNLSINIFYTALHDYSYEALIRKELDPYASGNTELSTSTSGDLYSEFMTYLQREDWEGEFMSFDTLVFPENLINLRISRVAISFERKNGTSAEVQISNLRFIDRASGNVIEGGSTQTVNGIVSTLRSNGISWQPFIGNSPIGTWELGLDPRVSDGRFFKSLFEEGEITSFIFVLTYEGMRSGWNA